MRTLEERFWEKVQKGDGCWTWTASKSGKGYGQMSQGRRGLRPLQAHRVSWSIHFGAVPEGMCVLHRCDNPSCVRPDHLFLGTIQDNDLDRDRKNRVRHGQRHPYAKLTEDQVSEARRLRQMGWKIQEIIDGLELPISFAGLSHALNGDTWKRVG